jgi:hypothetical protein
MFTFVDDEASKDISSSVRAPSFAMWAIARVLYHGICIERIIQSTS